MSSGQSPTSTHPGSPPSMISGISNKRPGYYESADGFQTKRQRISHYVKPSDPPQSSKYGLNHNESTHNFTFLFFAIFHCAFFIRIWSDISILVTRYMYIINCCFWFCCRPISFIQFWFTISRYGFRLSH